MNEIEKRIRDVLVLGLSITNKEGKTISLREDGTFSVTWSRARYPAYFNTIEPALNYFLGITKPTQVVYDEKSHAYYLEWN